MPLSLLQAPYQGWADIKVLSYKDLRHTRFPMADLSNGLFDHADLRYADIRGVKLPGAWLNHAKLGGVLMEAIALGEKPYLSITTFAPICTAYSPDGKYVATGSQYGTICLWKVTTREWIATLTGHGGPITSLCFNLRTNRLASGSADKTIRIWTLPEGGLYAIFYGHTKPVTCLAFNAKGDVLASGSEDMTIRLWGFTYRLVEETFIHHQKEKKVFRATSKRSVIEGHSASVTSLAFSPDESVLISGSDDNTLRLWQLEEESCLTIIKDHKAPIKAVCFSANAKTFASGGCDNSIYLWAMIPDGVTPKLAGVLSGHAGAVNTLAFSPDSKFLASGGLDHTVRLWSLEQQALLKELHGHTDWVCNVAFSQDNQLLVSGSLDSTVKFWTTDFVGLSPAVETSGEENELVPEETALVLSQHPIVHKFRLWSAEGKKTSRDLKNKGAKPSICLFNTTDDKKSHLSFWASHEKKAPLGVHGHKAEVTSLAISPDGLRMASGGWDNRLCLWLLEDTQEEVTELPGYTSCVKTVCFSPNGRFLATGSGDGQVILWDVANQQQLSVFAAHPEFTESIAIRADSRLLASCGWGKVVRLWDIETRELMTELCGHRDFIKIVVFSPQGNLLASGGKDKTIRLWDTAREEGEVFLLKELKQHTSTVMALAFNADGTLLISGDASNTLCLWDVNRGICVARIKGASFWDKHAIKAVCFSQDNLVAVGDSNGGIRLFRVNKGICTVALECLTTFQLKYPVETLAFRKREATEDILCVGSGRGLYGFELKAAETQWKLVLAWTIGRDTGFVCEGTVVGGAVVEMEAKPKTTKNGREYHEHKTIDRDAINEQTLKQHGAVGTLSPKTTLEVSRLRRFGVPYDAENPPVNLFTENHFIEPGNGMVTMTRKKDGEQGEHHVFLIIEYINEWQCYTVLRAEFFLDQSQNFSEGVISTTGKGLVELHFKAVSEIRELVPDCVKPKIWTLTTKQLKKLLANLEADQTKELVYDNVSRALSSHEDSAERKTHNCLTWCEGHLARIKLDTTGLWSWFDPLFAYPGHHLPDEPKKTLSL